MNYIQNSSVCQPTLTNKSIAGVTSVLTVSAMVLFIIGLTATHGGPFNVISQLGPHHNRILLGTSIFLFILDLVWLAVIKKNSSKDFEPVDLIPCPLPEPLIRLWLSYLDAESLEQMAQGWKQAQDPELWNAFDLKDYCPQLTIFDSELWEKEFALMGLRAKDIKPICGKNKRALIPVLKVLSPQVEGDAGITILTIPKGLTFNKLVAFAETLKGQYRTIFNFIWDKFRDRYGNETIPETYRVVLTNNVLRGTRIWSIQAQKKLVDELDIGCDLPKVIELCTLLIAAHMTSFTSLLNGVHSTCAEKIDAWRSFVGRKGPWFGLNVDSDYFGHVSLGLVGRWKLPDISP